MRSAPRRRRQLRHPVAAPGTLDPAARPGAGPAWCAQPPRRADDLFDKGQFSDALALFQGQAQAATKPQIQQEARCKAGLCLLQLNRADQAAELFAPLLNEPGERWPPVAAGQLLLIRLQQNRFDDMDALLANIRNRFRFEQLAGHVPTTSARASSIP